MKLRRKWMSINTGETLSIHVNSIGYLPEQNKRATVVGEGKEGLSFSLLDYTGNLVFQGKLEKAPDHPAMQNPLFWADFTEVKTPGRYRVSIDEYETSSSEFKISEGVYNPSLQLNMLGFYGQRCGVPVRIEHKGNVFSKKACHCNDGYLDYVDPSKKGSIKDATGGWHDAGDYGKYIVNAGFSMGMMLSAWEEYSSSLVSLTFNIPETGGSLPDYLAECKFNLDWMLKMQFEEGRVAHKLTRTGFSPMIMPSEDHENRYFVPWGTDATACFAATMSQASRVYREYDPGYADTCLDAARKAMQVLKDNPSSVRSDQSAFNTGRYDRIRHSDREWALMEFWATTGDPEIERFIEFLFHNENYHVDIDWDWGLSKNLGIYTLLRCKNVINSDLIHELTESLFAAADRIVKNNNTHPFGRGLKRCYWGCNGSIARTTMNLMAAYRLSGKEEYRSTALDQLSYLYGNNPFGRSFVTGEGQNPPMNPHHRPSAADGITDPWPGHLIGGPHPTELDWYDVTEDPRTNETAINWDAAMAYALASFYDPSA